MSFFTSCYYNFEQEISNKGVGANSFDCVVWLFALVCKYSLRILFYFNINMHSFDVDVDAILALLSCLHEFYFEFAASKEEGQVQFL